MNQGKIIKSKKEAGKGPYLKKNHYYHQLLCHVGNTSPHSDTDVKQHWVSTLLGLETPWELILLLEWVQN